MKIEKRKQAIMGFFPVIIHGAEESCVLPVAVWDTGRISVPLMKACCQRHRIGGSRGAAMWSKCANMAGSIRLEVRKVWTRRPRPKRSL